MDENREIAKACMLAGKIMLQSGAETNRVEDTMTRIASAFGLKETECYATPTTITFAVDYLSPTFSMRIINRSTDLHKITEVNRISREFTRGNIKVCEAITMLQKVDNWKLFFSKWKQVIAAALVSGCFAIMFGGTWPDFMPALLIGGIAYGVMLLVDRYVEIRFIADFFASFVIGVLAVLSIHYSFGADVDRIIIGAVMPLVPGLPITNAVRDLLSGHLVAGLSKGVEALLTAFAIGAGVAIIFIFT